MFLKLMAMLQFEFLKIVAKFQRFRTRCHSRGCYWVYGETQELGRCQVCISCSKKRSGDYREWEGGQHYKKWEDVNGIPET